MKPFIGSVVGQGEAPRDLARRSVVGVRAEEAFDRGLGCGGLLRARVLVDPDLVHACFVFRCTHPPGALNGA